MEKLATQARRGTYVILWIGCGQTVMQFAILSATSVLVLCWIQAFLQRLKFQLLYRVLYWVHVPLPSNVRKTNALLNKTQFIYVRRQPEQVNLYVGLASFSPTRMIAMHLPTRMLLSQIHLWGAFLSNARLLCVTLQCNGRCCRGVEMVQIY